MKYVIIISALTLIVCLAGAATGYNTSATVLINAKNQIVNEKGEVLIPLMLKEVSSVEAADVLVKYEGDIGNVKFEPGEYLHDPIVLDPRIDREKQTIRISMAATGRVVSRDDSGVIGYLVVDQDVQITSLTVIEAKLLNEDNKIDTIVEAPKGSGGSSEADVQESKRPAITKTQLFQSFPNPANPTTTISFDLKNRETVRLDIFDVGGRLVRALVNDQLSPDHYEITWDGRGNSGETVSSGVYFYRFRAGSYSETKKLIILK